MADSQTNVLNNLNNQFAEQKAQPTDNTKQETLLTMFSNAIADSELKTQLQVVLKQPTTKSQMEALNDFIGNLGIYSSINNEPEAAHIFVYELAKTDPHLCKMLCDKQLAQTKNVDYQNTITKQNITELFDYVVKNKLLDREMQQKIRARLFKENGELQPEFTGAKDEVMKSVFSLCETVYASKKMHAAYSELKWPAFMLWGAIFRLIVSKLAEKDPAYLQLLEAETKPNTSNMPQFIPR